MTDTQTFKLEEYKTLRTETLRYIEDTERNMLAAIAAVGAALYAGLQPKNDAVLALAAAIALFFWVQHRNKRQAIGKIGAYVAVFIETPDTGLAWETRIRHPSVPRPTGFQLTAYRIRRLLLPYPVLFATSILLLVVPRLALCGLYVQAGFGVGVLAIVGLVSWLTDESIDSIVTRWRQIFRTVESCERAQAAASVVASIHSNHE